MSLRLQHYLNPLHVYCRLLDFGLGRNAADRLCRMYEQFVFSTLFGPRDG